MIEILFEPNFIVGLGIGFIAGLIGVDLICYINCKWNRRLTCM